jgi:hypothetical protein
MKQGQHKKLVRKETLKGKIDDYIYDQMNLDSYEVGETEASSLLTSNRLDLAFKLLYLENQKIDRQYAEQIYWVDIYHQTQGTFREVDNDGKNSFDRYKETFAEIFGSISAAGQDEKQSLIPVSASGSIFNGSHRTASLIQLGQKARYVHTDLPDHFCNYEFYKQRGVNEEVIEAAVVKFIEYAHGVYLAFLWPSGQTKWDECSKLFDRIVYIKQLSLGLSGARNLIYELYKHMEWIGTPEDGYPGVSQKFSECFTTLDEGVLVIAFQADSLDEVRKIKARIRGINGIGFSSVHITDTYEEAVRISNLIFNVNGRHFLRNAQLFLGTSGSKVAELVSWAERTGVSSAETAFDGSVILAMYGIRENRDIDFISLNTLPSLDENHYDDHDHHLTYHGLTKEEIIGNPRYHFCYEGLKFVSFHQLLRMKESRRENKDRNDVAAMKLMDSERGLGYEIRRCLQFLAYRKLQTQAKLRMIALNAIKKAGFYEEARSVYRKYLR